MCQHTFIFEYMILARFARVHARARERHIQTSDHLENDSIHHTQRTALIANVQFEPEEYNHQLIDRNFSHINAQTFGLMHGFFLSNYVFIATSACFHSFLFDKFVILCSNVECIEQICTLFLIKSWQLTKMTIFPMQSFSHILKHCNTKSACVCSNHSVCNSLCSCQYRVCLQLHCICTLP